ncbi:MAG TPA: serine/threonine-protein kinase, partial [Polyangiaceae bacterium]
TESGTPYLVMELLEGRTLEGILAVRRTVGVADAVYIGLQLCDALATAHEHGIFHRDIKPSNVFISRTESGREVAKIFDFGIARLQGGQKLTQQGALLGTPEYMPPEQLLAKDEIDARSDIYALGVTLYEALAGVVPFEGNFGEVLLKVSTEPVPPLDQRCKEVPGELARAIERALSRDPVDRFATAREFAEALVKGNVSDEQPSSLLGLRRKPSAVGLSPSPKLVVGPARVPRPDVSVPPRPRPPLAAGAVPLPLLAESLSLGAVPPPLPNEPSQRRRFARAPYVTPARILRPDGSTLEGRSEDISVGGLLVLAGQKFDSEEQVRVHFALPFTGKLLEVPATAKWVKMARGTGAVGLQFASLPPDAHAVIENYVTAMGGE